MRAKRPVGVFSVFLGPALSISVVSPPAPVKLRLREKPVAIRRGALISPHVVDLTSGAPKASARPDLDFGQKAAVFAYRMKRALFPFLADEERRVLAPSPRADAAETPAKTTRAVKVSEPVRPAAPAIDRVALEAKVRKLEAVIGAKPAAQAARGTIRTPFDGSSAAALLPVAVRTSWWRPVVAFVSLAVVVTLPIHMIASYTGVLADAGTVSAGTKEAFAHLKAAGDAIVTQDAQAAETFDRAAASFAETRAHLSSATLALAAFASGNGGTFKSGGRVLAAGEALAKVGAAVSDAFDALDRSGDIRVTDKLSALSSGLAAAEPHLNEAVRELDAIPADTVPEANRALFEDVRADLRSVRDNTHRFIASSDLVMRLLGADDKRRYLVVFQNDRELRPTGGFIGSFALMDVQDGEIMDIEVPGGGSYDLRWGLNERLAAPEQLRLVNTRWEFQDANWFADFPTSAKTLQWFYEKSGGPTIDGIIAVNTRLMESLLAVLGPVDMAEYGKTVTAANFFLETQKAVELEYDKAANKPKQFVADMAPKVLERLLGAGKDDLVPLMNALSESLTRKDVQVWFRDAAEQAAASEYGWTGELKALPDADFLAVIDTNIAGGKTDGVVAADIRHETEITEDGGMIDTVTVRRTHGGKKDDLFTGIKNIDYLRVYVPSGSELLSAEGFERPGEGYFLKADDTLKPPTLLTAVEGRATVDEGTGTRITQESGFTVFGNWIQLEPGESRAVKLRYRLPFRFDRYVSAPKTLWDELRAKVGAFAPTADLKLTVHRQAGSAGRTFTTAVRPPKGWSIRSRIPEVTSGPLERDLYYGTVLVKQE